MTLLITLVHVIVCLLLVAVILLQAGRGQGLTGPSFGSGNVQSLFGTRAADFLSKTTSVAAICFLFTCITLDVIEGRKSRSLLEGARQSAPVDMNAIKKALAKIKEEQKSSPGQTAQNPAEKNIPPSSTPAAGTPAPPAEAKTQPAANVLNASAAKKT